MCYVKSSWVQKGKLSSPYTPHYYNHLPVESARCQMKKILFKYEWSFNLLLPFSREVNREAVECKSLSLRMCARQNFWEAFARYKLGDRQEADDAFRDLASDPVRACISRLLRRLNTVLTYNLRGEFTLLNTTWQRDLWKLISGFKKCCAIVCY